MERNRFANPAQRKSAEANPLKARGGLGRGVKMTERSIVRAGCHAPEHSPGRTASGLLSVLKRMPAVGRYRAAVLA